MDAHNVIAILELQLLMVNPIKRMLLRNHVQYLKRHLQLQGKGEEHRPLSYCLYERLTILYGTEKISGFEMRWMEQVMVLLESTETEALKEQDAEAGQEEGS